MKWLESINVEALGIVASCDLSHSDAALCLEQVQSASPLVTGLRWLLQPAHSARVNGTDLIKDEGFRSIYASLKDTTLSWDLQCDVDQLDDFRDLMMSRNQETLVVINHLGRLVAWPADATTPDQDAILAWREAMTSMAALDNTYVKISMLGHMVADWIADTEKEALVRDLVLETVSLFGPDRCMVNTNWWFNAAVADSDFAGTVGPEPVQFLEKTKSWFDYGNITEKDQEWLYWKSAEVFYLGRDFDEKDSSDTTSFDTSIDAAPTLSRFPIYLLLFTVLSAVA